MADNELSAADKRKQAIARREAVEKIEHEYGVIAKQIPDQWDAEQDGKVALVKAIHSDLLGKDKEGRGRPLTDLRYFMFQAAQRNLNPFKKQVHAYYIYDKSKGGEQLVVVTSIDGYTSLAKRTKEYAGMSETRFTYKEDSAEYPEKAVVDIYAYNPITGAREIVQTATAWWEEYAQWVDKYEDVLDEKGKPIWKKTQAGKSYKETRKTGEKTLNSTWARRPKGQLEKCAQALGLRRQWPEELGGLYVEQEIDHLKGQQPETPPVETQSADDIQRSKIEEQLKDRKKAGSVFEGEVVKEGTDNVSEAKGKKKAKADVKKARKPRKSANRA